MREDIQEVKYYERMSYRGFMAVIKTCFNQLVTNGRLFSRRARRNITEDITIGGRREEGSSI